MSKIRVTVWNEYRHEREQDVVAKVYPDGLHAAIAAGLGEHADFDVRTATLDEPDHGLTQDVLDNTDVLTWWGHKAHHEVRDEIVERVADRVYAGMGLIALHSGHHSKIFRKLMGTRCSLRWREADERERIWVVEPGHPIAAGLGPYFEIPEAEMYGEYFDIPAPESLVFVSWFQGGEVFRSGCCYRRGNGKVFYFRPGHETYPIYYMPEVRQVLANAVRWAAPTNGPAYPYLEHAINATETLESLPERDARRERVG
ncbi:MAG: ThuA domain-containing protein [Caldilineaceae bacterium]|nr:ThuA domain-containing protein [Caldilineaceae bacterium]